MPDLAGGESFQGKQSVVEAHTATVVDHFELLHAPGLKLDGDARGSRVEAVLDEFLHHRGRPLHHFAGGDPVGHALFQYLDFTHGCTYDAESTLLPNPCSPPPACCSAIIELRHRRLRLRAIAEQVLHPSSLLFRHHRVASPTLRLRARSEQVLRGPPACCSARNKGLAGARPSHIECCRVSY